MKIFLTGEKGIGKTTIIKKILNKYDGKYNGYFTKKQGRSIVFSNMKGEELFSFKYDDNPNDIGTKFDIYGVEQLLEAYDDAELIVMDELGFLERKSKKFKMAVMNIVKSEKSVLIVLKNYKFNFFYDNLKDLKGSSTFNIDMENRDDVPDEILKILTHEKV